MRRAEGETASALAADDVFVIADGPLNELEAKPVVGYIKSHRVTYLEPEQNAVVAQLAPGQRTPLFTIAEYRRYSWYVRLAMLQGGHSWTGIVRCEASGQLPKEAVRTIADRTAALLPVVASEAHLDPRAPQNLVPDRCPRTRTASPHGRPRSCLPGAATRGQPARGFLSFAWLLKCSIVTSGPGNTNPTCPSSDHLTRYGGPPSGPRTSRTSPSRSCSPTCCPREDDPISNARSHVVPPFRPMTATVRPGSWRNREG